MSTMSLRELGLGREDPLDELAQNSALALEEAAAALDLESWITDRLRHPVDETTSFLQLVRDSGEATCVPLFQVQHSAMFGSTAGSFSLRSDLQLHTCEAIAMERAWQAALLDLPVDGASYGLVCDPDALSERELMRLLSTASRRLRLPGGQQAIIFPGGGCRRECMAKLFAETRDSGDLIVTGKPDCLGGLNLDRFQAEGVAAVVFAELRRMGKALATARVVIQGFGPSGQAVSKRLAGEGLMLVGLSDNSGGLYRADGLILDDILSRYNREPLLFGYSEAEHINRADLLGVNCDVLVLTSGSHEIHGKNSVTISAPLVIEGDWNAVTAGAKHKLTERNIQVVPWSVSTAGALLGAWWERCEMPISCRPEDLLTKTYACVERVLAKVAGYSSRQGQSLDQAARQLAVERVAESRRLCGARD